MEGTKEDITEDTTEDITEDTTEDITEDTTEDITEDTTEDITAWLWHLWSTFCKWAIRRINRRSFNLWRCLSIPCCISNHLWGSCPIL
jgi:hypothetical protein